MTKAEPASDVQMFIVLRWDRFPTWPSAAVGSIVDSRAEAVAAAERELSRAVARGLRMVRFTVHQVAWPPVYESAAGA
jgi:4'-phosphopantetheinyl transferase EntD